MFAGTKLSDSARQCCLRWRSYTVYECRPAGLALHSTAASNFAVRLLYVGHTYLVNENQKKLTALAVLPDVEVGVVVPHMWCEPVLERVYPHIDPQAAYSIYPTKVLFPGNEMRYVYLSADLRLREFAPDVLVVENGAGSFAYTQALLYRQRYAPHAATVFFTWWNLPYHSRQPFRAIERYNLQHSDGAIAGNRDAAAILETHGYAGPLLISPQLGVDEAVFCPRDSSEKRRSLGLGKFVIGYAGRLVPEKGLNVLMDALEEFSSAFELLIIGRGPLESALREWGKGLGAQQRLHLLPSVPHSEIAGWMNAMDVFVLPSLTTDFWKEQFGHVLIEAMACEVSVVGSSSAEIPNVIGDAGYVVPEGDPAALRSTLQHLATHPEVRVAMAARGRARVLAHYTHARIAQRTHAFFHAVLGSDA